VSRYQKDKTNLDLTKARDSEWQWHQLGHTQVCTSLQTNNHASTPPLSFFTGRILPPNQQCQSTVRPIISKSTKFEGLAMAVDDQAEISSLIPQGTLLWQPIFVGLVQRTEF